MRRGAKAKIPAYAVAGLCMAGLSLVLVLSAYVRLYEATSEAATLTAQLAEVETEKASLQQTYGDATAELYSIATTRLGLQEPTSWQQVTLPGRDHGEVLRSPTATPLENLKTNLQTAFPAYFSP